MQNALLTAIIAALHEIGALVLTGSLFFMLAVLLPAIGELPTPRQRLRTRCAAYRRLFRWGWIGLALLWATAVANLLLAAAPLPTHLAVMAVLSLLFTLLFLLAQFGLAMQATVALEDGNGERAAHLIRLLSRVLLFALLLAITVVVLDVAGSALIPPDLIQGVLG